MPWQKDIQSQDNMFWTTRRYQAIKAFYERYERFWVPGFLVIGFLGDFITFRVINIRAAFILLGVHAVLAAGCILFNHLYDENREWHAHKRKKYLRMVTGVLIQLNFGALLSASLVFYWFSGSLSVSWPFILIIAALMTSNEVLRDFFQGIQVQIGVYYFSLFSYFSLVLPYIFNSISAFLFVLGGLIALLILYYYVHWVMYYIPRYEEYRVNFTYIIVGVCIFMNTLYFANIIPPIPLSLREAVVAHNLERTGDSYVLSVEPEHWIQRIFPGQTIMMGSSRILYLYTSIFAPSDLRTDIVHSWQFKNPETGKWETRSEPSFGIEGGREDGYRGYSLISSIEPGLWRIDVENHRGQVLGRVRFRVFDEDPKLIEVTK